MEIQNCGVINFCGGCLIEEVEVLPAVSDAKCEKIYRVKNGGMFIATDGGWTKLGEEKDIVFIGQNGIEVTTDKNDPTHPVVTVDGNQLSEKVNEVTGKVNEVSGKVNEVTEKVNEVTEKVNEVTEKVNEVTEKVNEVTGKVNEVSEKVNEVTGKVNEVTGKVNEVTGKVNEVTGKVNDVSVKVNEVTGKVNDVSVKVEKNTNDIEALSGKLTPSTGMVPLSGFDGMLNTTRYGQVVTADFSGNTDKSFNKNTQTVVGTLAPSMLPLNEVATFVPAIYQEDNSKTIVRITIKKNGEIVVMPEDDVLGEYSRLAFNVSWISAPF